MNSDTNPFVAETPRFGIEPKTTKSITINLDALLDKQNIQAKSLTLTKNDSNQIASSLSLFSPGSIDAEAVIYESRLDVTSTKKWPSSTRSATKNNTFVMPDEADQTTLYELQ